MHVSQRDAEAQPQQLLQVGRDRHFYDPAKVVRVEATEPDATMLRYARNHIKQACVPVHLTLVFCSVEDPLRGFREIMRVLSIDTTRAHLVLPLDSQRIEQVLSNLVGNAIKPGALLIHRLILW
jgi:signal transduction histidine kinase